MVLNPRRDFRQGVEALLSALRNELCSQFLVGNSTDGFAGVRANQGGDISAAGLGVQYSLQCGIEVGFRHLRLVRQSRKALDGDVSAIHGERTVGCASSNKNIYHLFGDRQSCAIHLNAFEDVGFTSSSHDGVNLLLGFLSQQLQLAKFGQVLGVVRHIRFLLLSVIVIREYFGEHLFDFFIRSDPDVA